MRRLMHLSLLALSVVVSGALVSTAPAEAHNHTKKRAKKALVVKVQPRSYFDAGDVVPVGSLSNYARGPQFFSNPAYSSNGFQFGESALPPRIGGGTSPFNRF